MRATVGQPGASTRVFVYGTLMRGEGNHDLLVRARFLGQGRTPSRFALHDLGAFPGLVAGGEHAVEGEVYIVGPDTLARLDHLEGHPNWYRRAPIALEDGTPDETNQQPRAGVHGRPVIASGSWRARRKEWSP
jgi:gamma-glutamylaminecyclotransferase